MSDLLVTIAVKLLTLVSLLMAVCVLIFLWVGGAFVVWMAIGYAATTFQELFR